jgi:hypothetical protein
MPSLKLVNLAPPGPINGTNSCNGTGNCDEVFSYPMVRDLARANMALTGIAAHRFLSFNLAYRNQTVSGDGVLVSGSYFPTLGIQPALGRLLGPSDDQVIGAYFVAVLSYRYRETRLGASRDVLGSTIHVNGRPFTIVGVASRGFEGTTLGSQALVFVPICMRKVLTPTFNGFEDRTNYWIYAFARLAPGVSMPQATAAINAVYKPIIQNVEAPLQRDMSATTMRRFMDKEVVLADGRHGQSQMRSETRAPRALLFAITGIVLLMTCANIANLLLARGANRSLEMAVRCR